jgi:hypothetical protein
MRNFSTLRVVLAAVTMLGAFHLRAEAAPRVAAAAATSMNCYQEMYDLGWNTCESSTGGNWSYGYITFWEFADGSCVPLSVECY